MMSEEVLFFNAMLLLAKNEKILKMANRHDRKISSNRGEKWIL